MHAAPSLVSRYVDNYYNVNHRTPTTCFYLPQLDDPPAETKIGISTGSGDLAGMECDMSEIAWKLARISSQSTL